MKVSSPPPRLYLVGVFDIVGLSNIFQSFKGVPSEAGENSPFDGALKGTLGFIQWARAAFPKLFDPYPFEKNRLAPYERDLHKIETLLGETEVKVQAFADLIVPFAVLPEAGHHLRALSAIFRMFYSAGSLLILSMAGGRAIRGGIDAESAVERAPEEIYGRALNEALALEMRQADYPRIAIGHHVRDYLKQVSQINEHSVLADHAKDLAARCSRLIIEDTDRQPILHYLSQDFRPSSLEPSDFAQAQAFIIEQQSAWTSTGQTRLAEKYQRLQQYWQRFGTHRASRKV